MTDTQLLRRTATVASRNGLHARPAGLIAAEAGAHDAVVQLSRDGDAWVDAASMLAVMTLGAGAGDDLVVSAEGSGAEAALAAVVRLVETDLDE